MMKTNCLTCNDTEFLFNPDLAYDFRKLNKLRMCHKFLSNISENVQNADI